MSECLPYIDYQYKECENGYRIIEFNSAADLNTTIKYPILMVSGEDYSPLRYLLLYRVCCIGGTYYDLTDDELERLRTFLRDFKEIY